MKRIGEIIYSLNWKPDYSNPHDIRKVIIKGPGNGWRFYTGILMLAMAMCELGGGFIAFPAIVVHCDKAIETGENILINSYLPLLFLLNTVILSVIAAYGGFKFIKGSLKCLTGH